MALLKVSSPDSLRRKNSPCSLKLVTVELPSGAHFSTKSAIHSRLDPVKDCVTGLPDVSTSSNVRSRGEVRRCESPARQAVLAPKSPPTWPNRVQAAAPFLFGSVAGKLRPRPSSLPSSTSSSLGATHFSCTPSSFRRPPRNAL